MDAPGAAGPPRQLAPQACEFFLEHWEARGAWPDAVRHSIIALVPKEGAQREKGLRPIGILSYVYRLWMALRRATVGVPHGCC